ncbi:MAG: RidA family protein [bacterium]|nr:RidA family protein [bacterium]
MGKFQRLQPEGEFSGLMGAYSHGIKVPLPGADLIFLTGQKAMDSKGNIIALGDVEKQTDYIFQNIIKLLAEAGATLEDVVKAQIFVLNMQDFPKISGVRNHYFEKIRPTSVMVEVSGLSKKGCMLEIAVTAVKLHK